MAFLKSSRFLLLLFLVTTLTVGCLSLIISTATAQHWKAIWHEDEIITGAMAQGASQEEQREIFSWVIRSYEDRIGVFDLNGELEFVADVYIMTLPEADRKLLEQGIYVHGEHQLTAIMEDYTG